MVSFNYPVPQTDPPCSPRETLPTMYDLPSEYPEEPGLPDEFHDWQAQLLSLTFCPPHYPLSQIFYASDLNIYYDVHHPLWHKRPDWFGVVGVPRLYNDVDMRLSYVVWQEGVNPFVVVELLSPGTEREDLGEQIIAPDSEPEQGGGNGQESQLPSEDKPPRKWQVYEQILQIPYYVVFSRYTNQLRAFKLNGAHYQELELQDRRVWMSELDLGLELWQGEFQGINRLWLRWYDTQGNWILTEAERERQRAEHERQRAEHERQRAEATQARLDALMERLRESGIDPDTFFPDQG